MKKYIPGTKFEDGFHSPVLHSTEQGTCYKTTDIDPILKDARLLARLADCAPGDTCFDKYREAAARILAATEEGV